MMPLPMLIRSFIRSLKEHQAFNDPLQQVVKRQGFGTVITIAAGAIAGLRHVLAIETPATLTA